MRSLIKDTLLYLKKTRNIVPQALTKIQKTEHDIEANPAIAFEYEGNQKLSGTILMVLVLGGMKEKAAAPF